MSANDSESTREFNLLFSSSSLGNESSDEEEIIEEMCEQIGLEPYQFDSLTAHLRDDL